MSSSSDGGGRAPERSARRRWLLVVVCAAVILALSSIPGDALAKEIAAYDKLLHACEYAVFGALIARALRGRCAAAAAWAIAVAIAGAFGAFDEWYQTHTPERMSTAADVVADVVGAAIGALSVTLRRSSEGPHDDRA